MLGWVLKRGENNTAEGDGADTTIADQPDTPAPVFAARALKNALFGTPVVQPPSEQVSKAATGCEAPDTPSKPQGILLTPGTSTSRRKRVSFGHNVARDAKSREQNEALRKVAVSARHRTRLADASHKPQGNPSGHEKENSASENVSSDEWEEEDDEDHCSHDITLDLNEPHSQSGRYWKDECQKYRAEAKIEMDKLLRYKQMAKSFARQRDSEAVDLAEKLRDEQQKVLDMEKRIMDNAAQIASMGADGSERSEDLLMKLTNQTALAVQYRQRVQDLESQLEGRGKQDDASQDWRRRQVASPRTQKTLVETQRELRRARAQVKELGELREQVSSLKSQLRDAKRANEVGRESKNDAKEAERLRNLLKLAKEDSRQKDEEIEQLKDDYKALRQDSETHEQDTKAVLERAHAKISDLKKEIKALKASSHENPQPKSARVTSRADQDVEDVAERPNEHHRIFDEESVMAKRKTLREQYQDKPASVGEIREFSTGVSRALAERPNFEKPKWQPFVPRSPRNRTYLGEDIAKRIENGGVTPGVKERSRLTVPDLPALAKMITRPGARDIGDEGDAKVDLLQNRFVSLGGPETKKQLEMSSLAVGSSKSSMPPERRAAALARIEQSMAEKKRTQRRHGYNKENVQPVL